MTAGENLLPHVILEENGDILSVGLKDGTYFLNSVVNIELPTNPNLTVLDLSNASDIEGEVNTEELTINLANASDAKLTGHDGNIKINELSGASDFHYTGNATITLSPGVTSGASRDIPGIG